MHAILAFLIFQFLTLNAFATNSCQSLFLESTSFIEIETNQIRPLVFSNVEVFRRNNDIGQQQVGEIRLEKWFEIPPYNEAQYNFVGLDKDGKVYHAIDWQGQRRLARVLSGQRTFKELVLVNGNILLAVDADGNVFMYSPDVWRKSPRNKLIGQSLLLGTSMTTAVAAGLSLVPAEHLDTGMYSMAVGMLGFVSYMQSGFWGLYKFEKLNTFPDGFVPTPWQIETLSDLEKYAVEILRIAKTKISFAEDMTPPDHTRFPAPHSEATEDIR